MDQTSHHVNRENVDLIPLDKTHFEELARLARDRRIWELYTTDGTDPAKLVSAYASALVEREQGNQYPFVIFGKQANKLIGSTRYLDIQPAHRIQKIGGQFEGVLRNDMIRDNQTKRNSAYYSLIEEEWPDNKLKLTALYEAKNKAPR